MASSYVCPECGLEYDTISPPDGAVAVRSYPRRYRAALASLDDRDDADALLRRRPAPGVWSALEYTGHVAAEYPLFAEVLRRTAYEDHPSFDFPDPDEQVEREGFNSQPVEEVLSRFESGAQELAKAIEDVPSDGWSRQATFPWGDRDALTMMRNAVHEGHHHLRDIERVLDAVKRSRE